MSEEEIPVELTKEEIDVAIKKGWLNSKIDAQFNEKGNEEIKKAIKNKLDQVEWKRNLLGESGNDERTYVGSEEMEHLNKMFMGEQYLGNYKAFNATLGGMIYLLENDPDFQMISRNSEDHNRGKENNLRKYRRLETKMKQAKIFELDKDVKRLLMLTKPSHRTQDIRLPFESMFIETDFDGYDFDLDDVAKIKGILIYEVNAATQYDENTVGKILTVNFVSIEDGQVMINEMHYPITFNEKYIDYKLKFKMPEIYKTMKPKIKDFILNFLEYLNEPEVQVIHNKKTDKNIQRRIREGKEILPDTYKTRVVGKLSIYLNRIINEGKSFSHKHRFWVRGHWRRLRNEKRYKGNVGRRLWILPFVKGEGVLIDKQYSVDHTKNDERINNIKKEFIFFDDIEPATKPLKELR